MAQALGRSIFIIFTALALVALGGCQQRVSPKEAAAFNQALVDAQKRLREAGVEFGRSASAAAGGGTIEVSMLDHAKQKAVDAVARVKSDVQRLDVPKSASARAFHAAYLQMVEKEEKLLAEELDAIVKTLKDPTRPAEAKRKRIMLIVNYLTKMEQDAMVSVKDAQAAFAKEHGVTLR